ncbi:hypothetical protein [Exiguobacterium algae]|uniref:hypothetical protein n=1 Tax=Exiguobacterium algae TaxID=2751250 RepID=UPI001BE817BC|nr:hypothetical protein [Exiguobacterium algae]
MNGGLSNKALRASVSHKAIYQVFTFIFLGLMMIELLMGDLPSRSWTLCSIWFYAWQRERAVGGGPDHVIAQSNHWTLQLLIFSLLVGYFVSQSIELNVSVPTMIEYAFSFLLTLRGMTLVYALRQHKNSPNL